MAGGTNSTTSGRKPGSNIASALDGLADSDGLTAIRLRKLLPAILIVGVIVIISTYFGVVSQVTTPTDSETTTTSLRFEGERSDDAIVHYVKEAKEHTEIPGTAFAFLALGAQANQLNCPAAIESLVRYSGWGGDIYLLTDQEHCFDKELIAKNAGMKKEKLHYVVVDEKFSTGGFDIQHPRIGFRQARVRSLAMKTRLFEFITDPKVETIAFTDCDILFSTQGCAQEFAQAGPSWNDVGIKFSRIFYNEETGDLSDIHAGTFVVHREHSKETLAKWRSIIEKGEDDGDNDCFMDLYHEINKERNLHPFPVTKSGTIAPAATTATPASTAATPAVTTPATSTPETYIDTFPHLLSEENKAKSNPSTSDRLKNPLTPGEAVSIQYKHDKHYTGYPSIVTSDERQWIDKYRYEKFFHPVTTAPLLSNEEVDGKKIVVTKEQVCMNHISKARCSAYGRDMIQNYVNRYRLRTYEGKYDYCVSPMLQPLLYGWFPFGYLPWCPKIERYG